MLVSYLVSYLIFVMIVSALISIVLIKVKLSLMRTIVPIIAAIFILPLLAGYVYLSYFVSIPEVVVPDLTGIKVDNVYEKLNELELQGQHAGSVFNMSKPEGQIVSQNPASGRKVKAGRTIYFITSSGRQKVFVPNLLGRPAVQAEAVLIAKGLRLGRKREEIVPEMDPGIILSQSPLPGEEVSISTYVVITVSATPESDDEGGFKLW
jgi:beta-lactam-binding protein with PASTA domain